MSSSVLLVPTDGDPGGLLKCSLLGQRPPCVVLARAYASAPASWQSYAIPTMTTDDRPTALPLWWDGALVPEGWDRARRVAHGVSPGWSTPRVFAPPLDAVRFVAAHLADVGLCRVVVL